VTVGVAGAAAVSVAATADATATVKPAAAEEDEEDEYEGEEDEEEGEEGEEDEEGEEEDELLTAQREEAQSKAEEAKARAEEAKARARKAKAEAAAAERAEAAAAKRAARNPEEDEEEIEGDEGDEEEDLEESSLPPPLPSPPGAKAVSFISSSDKELDKKVFTFLKEIQTYVDTYNEIEKSKKRDKSTPKGTLSKEFNKLRNEQPINVLNDDRIIERLDILDKSRADKKRKTLSGGTRHKRASKTSSASRFRTTRKVRSG
jgi:hypothetical protein